MHLNNCPVCCDLFGDSFECVLPHAMRLHLDGFSSGPSGFADAVAVWEGGDLEGGIHGEVRSNL